MDFGSLQIATLWRLTKAGIVRRAVVMDAMKGQRLVIVEADRIVGWELFARASELRARAVSLRKELQRGGWVALTGHP